VTKGIEIFVAGDALMQYPFRGVRQRAGASSPVPNRQR
jgi:hypothetical protein